MTTLLISSDFPPKTGGSGRWFWEVYRRLPRQAFLIAAGEDPRQREFDKTHDLRVVRLPLHLDSCSLCSVTGMRGYWRATWKLWWLLRSANVRMVHCGRCLPEGVMALALKALGGPPFMCYVHGEEINGRPYVWDSRELGLLTRAVLRGAEFVIANSRHTARLLQQDWQLSPRRIRVLHPGVDTQRFSPVGPDAHVRAALGWGTRPVVLTVGRLQKRKGHDQMILALHNIRCLVPDVLYAIVGDGHERAALEALVAREGLAHHVTFMGECNDADLAACYQQCDLFVLPNRQVGQDIEGFGMVLLEAQACGKPVIAGASGGTAETMNIPQTGRVVDCSTPAKVGALVAEWLADGPARLRMGQAARAWTVERFDWSRLARRAEELFQNGMMTPAAKEDRIISRDHL